MGGPPGIPGGMGPQGMDLRALGDMPFDSTEERLRREFELNLVFIKQFQVMIQITGDIILTLKAEENQPIFGDLPEKETTLEDAQGMMTRLHRLMLRAVNKQAGLMKKSIVTSGKEDSLLQKGTIKKV